MTPRDQLDFRSIRVLDGAMATELEQRGCDISGSLWSAHVLEDAPAAIVSVHLDYLRAGADCISTASYQVSSLGYRELGRPAADSVHALQQSVALAGQARTVFARENPRRVWIAASLGPYGAALHNGAEYHGRYAIGFDDLVAFHAERFDVLAGTGADLLALETIPSLEEAQALLHALRLFPALSAWISFTCRDAALVAHGEPLHECAETLAESEQVAAIGINCTAPRHVEALIGEARRGCGDRKSVIVYPNSGETWDATKRTWNGASDPREYGALARAWYAAGAQAVGGCCRTRPAHIVAVAQAVGKHGLLPVVS
ncbi:MAG TPA: homocysteine S-methyltransferase [Acidobacteriaceae bacterium]|nr:homocysteine S-methyltransferase [Acidobacteriaceae bacterium]